MTPTRSNVHLGDSAAVIELVEPSLDRLPGCPAARLPGCVAALEAGWSPNTTRDVGGQQLAAIHEDAGAFLTRRERGGTVTLGGGSVVPRLPGRVLWICNGAFCGSINLRFAPGTLDILRERVGRSPRGAPIS